MRVISLRKIRDFYGKPEHASAKISFQQWYHTVTNREYRSFAQILADFNDAIRENELYIFCVDEGKYKMVTSIYFDTGCVYIRFVGTEGEYRTHYK